MDGYKNDETSVENNSNNVIKKSSALHTEDDLLEKINSLEDTVKKKDKQITMMSNTVEYLSEKLNTVSERIGMLEQSSRVLENKQTVFAKLAISKINENMASNKEDIKKLFERISKLENEQNHSAQTLTTNHNTHNHDLNRLRQLCGSPVFKWSIPKISKYEKTQSNSPVDKNLMSEPFYMRGYRFRLRLYPIGIKADTSISPIPISVAILLEKSELDPDLCWPIPGELFLRLVDTGLVSEFKFRHAKSSNKTAYMQPKSDRVLLEIVDKFATYKSLQNLSEDVLNIQFFIV